MLVRNKLKEKLNKGEAVLGTWNTLSSPLVTEVLAQSGLDFQIIDLEHGPFAIDKVYLHVSACENSQCTPLVRIPSNSDWMALQALDQGAHGVVVPHIDTVDDANIFVDATKYHPQGNRGFTPFSKAGGFTNVNVDKYVGRAIDETINIVIIESKEGLDNLEEILKVDAIDIVYFGAYDLSQALGHPGNTKHPEVVQAIQQGVNLVNGADKYAGGFVPQSKNEIQELLDMGMKFITYEVDSSIIHKHVDDVSSWFLRTKNE
jgi:4-hydroxy-2-oxoheptanedioate aldolase